MDNTVGSTSANFCNFSSLKEDVYILGLWCADSYWWSSSIGLSNVDNNLINRFKNFLKRFFPEERIKFNRNHLFVNSRPLLREFTYAENNIEKLLKERGVIKAYLAGRFDGDGSISKDLKSDCRIVYGNRKEAELDQKLLREINIENTKIYYYRTARTFALYVSRYQAEKFIKEIFPHSIKLQKLAFVPRRDLVSTREQET